MNEMASLHYLTVQDMLWINLQIEGKVNAFSYATLEEATYYQYGYGESTNLLPQAAKFLTGFVKLAPFKSSNEATAFIGVLAFLEMNGHAPALTDSDALSWYREAVSAGLPAFEKLGFHEDHSHSLIPDVKKVLANVIARYPNTLAALDPVGV